MSGSNRYLSRIDYCIQKALTARDPETRRIWLSIKESYDLLSRLDGGLAPKLESSTSEKK